MTPRVMEACAEGGGALAIREATERDELGWGRMADCQRSRASAHRRATKQGHQTDAVKMAEETLDAGGKIAFRRAGSVIPESSSQPQLPTTSVLLSSARLQKCPCLIHLLHHPPASVALLQLQLHLQLSALFCLACPPCTLPLRTAHPGMPSPSK